MNLHTKYKSIGLLAIVLFICSFSSAQVKHEWKEITDGNYTYKTVSGDPMQARFYTLENGLTVILTENKKEPRIAAKIAVRAGSNTDPKEHTGLAHYLEHLLFKGTDQYGTGNWEKEKPYIDKITDLYEVYTKTADPAKRKEIYQEIDKLSSEASQYSIANEYDKLMSAIGSQGTNAHTWVEETVYHEDIPSSSVDKFLKIQAERFRNPVFRLFHTELEAVYEEKNGSIDNDGWKVQEAMHRNLFPTHNYGQQSTIGSIEHLKNPSLVAIRNYYNDYYVPSNIALILSGDFKSDDLIKKIDDHFSYMKAKPIKEYNPTPEKPIEGVKVEDVYGPSAESITLVYRIGGSETKEAMMADLISSILMNNKAGLIDLNINKAQKMLGAYAGIRQYKDYGMFVLAGQPKQGQKLEELQALLLKEIENLKRGNFDDNLIQAIVANDKLSEILALDDNQSRAGALSDVFIHSKGAGWNQYVSYAETRAKVTKQDVMDFANQFFADNYAVINKREGQSKDLEKVEKPNITPVEMNTDKQSDYVSTIMNMSDRPVDPQWLDFKKDIKKEKLKGLDILYVENSTNDLFRQYYYYELGSYNSKLLPLAASYLSFLGTSKYTSEEISKKFYELAGSFSVGVENENTYVSITGLGENYQKTVSLLEHLIANAKVDDSALADLKGRLLKTRADNKLNKGAIMNALTSYATYGSSNPSNDVLSNDEIDKVTGGELLAVLKDLLNYSHRVIYYGPQKLKPFKGSLAKLHKVPSKFKTIPVAKVYAKKVQTVNEVLYANYDMVQADIRWVRNASAYSPEKTAEISLFNSYFGGGMGSVVFQTIRESKALAYSTFAILRSPTKKEDPYSILAFVGTQADKYKEAIKGMNELLTDLPHSEKGFNTAKLSMRNNIETERITEDAIVFQYLEALKKGLDYDIRKDVYSKINELTFSDIQKLHNNEIANKAYTYCIVASDDNIKVEELSELGAVKVLSLEELFGY